MPLGDHYPKIPSHKERIIYLITALNVKVWFNLSSCSLLSTKKKKKLHNCIVFVDTKDKIVMLDTGHHFIIQHEPTCI